MITIVMTMIVFMMDDGYSADDCYNDDDSIVMIMVMVTMC